MKMITADSRSRVGGGVVGRIALTRLRVVRGLLAKERAVARAHAESGDSQEESAALRPAEPQEGEELLSAPTDDHANAPADNAPADNHDAAALKYVVIEASAITGTVLPGGCHRIVRDNNAQVQCRGVGCRARPAPGARRRERSDGRPIPAGRCSGRAGGRAEGAGFERGVMSEGAAGGTLGAGTTGSASCSGSGCSDLTETNGLTRSSLITTSGSGASGAGGGSVAISYSIITR